MHLWPGLYWLKWGTLRRYWPAGYMQAPVGRVSSAAKHGSLLTCICPHSCVTAEEEGYQLVSGGGAGLMWLVALALLKV